MSGTALVTAASGLGDILRVTPLIRVCASLGYEVDVLLAPDYPETATLLQGAPEIRQLFRRPGRWIGAASADTDPLPTASYDVAIFTYWSSVLRGQIRAGRSLCFDPRKWLVEGDHSCVLSIARALGWNSELPAPFAMKSSCTFGLKPGTVALHPGCKPDWPWKKWHGFADLAGELPEVVVLGTPTDFDNSKTYFQKSHQWPLHVQDYSGQLSLLGAAALLAECAALVSNDSGIMHLGAALGIPTFGIFGITSPLRELTPRPNLFAITKGLACEPACHKDRWGRRDCERHLLCLKTLTAQEVLAKVREKVELRRVAAVAGD
jgi:hypothetical protein